MTDAGASCRTAFRRRVVLAVRSIAMLVVASPCTLADEPRRTVTIERASGGPVTGVLLRIDDASVQIEVDGRLDTLPLDTVRTVVFPDPAVGDTRDAAVAVTLLDGSRLTGDRFVWTGETAAITWGGEDAVLPAERLHMVAWPAPAAGTAAPWLALLPEPADSDVVVVGAGDTYDCVACALTAVTADAVTVVLDGETIPVRRDKVVGLRWLRDATPPRGIRVAVAGGTMQAATITWSPEGLVIDDSIRMPAAWLHGLDYASGRTVSLVGLEPERVDVEPFFGGLADVAGLASFFAPRVVPGDAAAGGLVVRPRTRAVWRVPEDARRFRATAVPAAPVSGDALRDVGVMTIALDGRAVLHEPVLVRTGRDAGAVPAGSIDIDVSTARRLEILVDFPDAGGMGGPVLLRSPAFEK
jgi:hypothetical protein